MKKVRRILILGLAIALAFGNASAGEAVYNGLQSGEEGEVEAVLSGDGLRLVGGLEVRLEAVRAPRSFDDKTNRYKDDSEDLVRRLVTGATVGLAYAGPRRDRYGRARAHVFVKTPDGARIWVQHRLTAAGLARVSPAPDAATGVAMLLQAEAAARAERRGIWSSPAFQIVDAGAADASVDRFALVGGTVETTASVGQRIYVNFGTDYRTDFTIAIARKDAKRFETAGLDLTSLAGRRVLARGWVRTWNGPYMEVRSPEALQILATD
ncbi:MAG: thermonuclease family protein [Pseudomonadota bacterium]